MKRFLSILLICSMSLAEVVISPNMNLPVPVVGTTSGPDWANNINSCMGAIDSHDHTPGHGVPISSSSLSITSDLPLNNNSLTQAKAVVFTGQSSFSTKQSIYVVSPDLIYNDGNGNVVRITQNGSVSGAAGTITGLPSGTASASYQAGGGTFQFQSSTNTPANGSFASLSIAEQAASPNTVTLKSPGALASSYNVTFPTSVPSFTSLLTMSTAGILSTVGYKAPTIQTFTSGTIQTYTTPTSPSPLYLKIKLVGGGGGGGGSGTTSGTAATDGGITSFKTSADVSILVANGGLGGSRNGGGGGGGGASITSPGSGIAISGGKGAASVGQGGGIGNQSPNLAGGQGASSALGGGGAGGAGNNDNVARAGQPAATNSGSGGGGGNAVVQNGVLSGDGGGAGGYIEAIIPNPSSTYHYSVGAAGSGQPGGVNGGTGGDGAAGIIMVEEYYQ